MKEKNLSQGEGTIFFKTENIADILADLSLDAGGMLIRMANNPSCDYTTIEEFHRLYPADSISVYKKAFDELLHKNYVLKVGKRYTVNKTKMLQKMVYLGKSEDKEKSNVNCF